MYRKMFGGETSQSLPIFVSDSSSSTGAGLGSLVFNTGGLAAKYRRQGDSAWTTITLVTMTLGTWASGGFIADAGPVTGGYEFGVPNAAIAAGVEWVEIQIYGAANMLPVLILIELDKINYQSGTNAGLSALPTANPGASAGIARVQDLPAASLDASGIRAALGLASANLDTQLSGINNNVLAITSHSARMTIGFAAQMEIPGASTTPYEIDLLLWDLNGNNEDADSLPSIAARDSSGTSLNANLSATSMTRIALGRYKVVYNLPSNASAGSVMFDITAIVGAASRTITAVADVASAYATDFTSTDRTKLNQLATDYTTARAAKIDNLDATVSGVPVALLDLAAGVETGLTLRQALRLMVAACAGKLSGAGTTTITIRNFADTKNRITATVDTNDNRTAVAYDLT